MPKRLISCVAEPSPAKRGYTRRTNLNFFPSIMATQRSDEVVCEQNGQQRNSQVQNGTVENNDQQNNQSQQQQPQLQEE